MRRSDISFVFGFAAFYDGILGLIFLLLPGTVFDLFGVGRPNHPGYVQFPALLLLIFAAMFVQIARRPRERRNLIPYGMMLKASYCGVIFGWWLTAGIPYLWKPFAVADLAFLGLFWQAYRKLGSGSPG